MSSAILNTKIYSNYKLKTSHDGTKKIEQRLHDGLKIEICVLNIPYRQISKVVCVSSQAGCPLHCDFCRSGHRSFFRNLSAMEILEQVNLAKNLAIIPYESSFDVTYMGIGEPLLNYEEVVRSFFMLLEEYPQIHKINVSTVGPEGGIAKLSKLFLKGQLHLQLSLHSPFDKERSQLFRYNLPSVENSISDLAQFGKEMNDIPCVNYVLFDHVNDSSMHAKRLIRLVPPNYCYLKISKFCPIQQSSLKSSSKERRDRFMTIIRQSNLLIKTFNSQGQDIRAGCGQLIVESD